MPSASETSQGNQGLRALDADLASLASEAAIDIEYLLLKRETNSLAIQRLAERLNNSIEVTPTGDPPHSLMDPVTLTILNEAVAKAKNKKSLQKVEELLVEAAEIAKALSRANLMDNHEEELKQARDFCVAFSRAVMAYHKSIHDLHPSHPFRR